MSSKKEKLEEKRNNKRKFIYVVIILFVVMIFAALVVALNNAGLLKFDQLDKLTTKRAELKYTETNNKVKEGIYITDVSEVVEEVMPSIVSITSKTIVSSGMFGPFYGGGEQYATGAGSGIIVSKTDSELLILTNNHVVEDAEELSVQFVNEKSVDATIKGTSENKDVAVITVKLDDLDKETTEAIKIATLGDSTKLKVGNGVIAIGNALGYGQSVTTGVVSALDRELAGDSNNQKMIQLDAAINGGNSGGALLNNNGEVVGINSAKYSSNAIGNSASIEGMGFAIPISDVKDLITDLMNGKGDTSESTSGGTIGVEGYMISESQGKAYNMPAGFYISKVNKNSGADKAGLEIGNIITKAEGKKVEEFKDLKSVISEKKKGEKVKLTITYTKGNEYKEKTVEVEIS